MYGIFIVFSPPVTPSQSLGIQKKAREII